MPGPVVADGERVTFRTVERDDAAFLHRANTDPRVRWSLGLTAHGNREERRGRIERDAEGDGTHAFVVCLDGEGAPAGHPGGGDTTAIGAVHARGLDGDRAWLGYWLHPDFRGEGYGREMGGLVVDYVFRTSDVHGVSAAAFGFNEESRGLLESLGFADDAREREAYYSDGEYHDVHVYGLLRRGWEPRCAE